MGLSQIEKEERAFGNVPFYTGSDITHIIAAQGTLPPGQIPNINIGSIWEFRADGSELIDRRILLQRELEGMACATIIRQFLVQIPNRQMAEEYQRAAKKCYMFAQILRSANQSDLGSIKYVIAQCRNLEAALKPVEFVVNFKYDNENTILDITQQVSIIAIMRRTIEGGGLLSIDEKQNYIDLIQKLGRLLQDQCLGSKPANHGGSRHHRNLLLDDHIINLGKIYRLVFSAEPYRGNPDGPFTRYIEACLKPVFQKDTPSRTAIRKRWLRLCGKK